MMVVIRRDEWPNRTGTSEMSDLERERRARGLEQLDMARIEGELERLRNTRPANFATRDCPPCRMTFSAELFFGAVLVLMFAMFAVLVVAGFMGVGK